MTAYNADTIHTNLQLTGLQGSGGGGGSDIFSLLGPLSGALSGVSFKISVIYIYKYDQCVTVNAY